MTPPDDIDSEEPSVERTSLSSDRNPLRSLDLSTPLDRESLTLSALAYSASKSVNEDVGRIDELRLGAISMERDSRGCKRPPRLEIAPSSVARVRVIVRDNEGELRDVKEGRGEPKVCVCESV